MGELTDVSAVMQDYLESIYRLQMQKRVIRVKDIAKELGVKAPTASETLRLLGERGFVEHERYEDVRLSPEGARIAQQVHNRHRIICGFLTDVLRVDSETAEKDACAIEHSLSPSTINRLVTFMGYIHSEKESSTVQLFEEYTDRERHVMETRPAPGSVPTDAVISSLASMRPGQEGTIRRIAEGGAVRTRLMEMGVLRGERVRFVREAPLGDPIEINVRGYNLSLRKSEAGAVEVVLDEGIR
ncbi:MAG: DtxR family transcriptional regulator [bacterium]